MLAQPERRAATIVAEAPLPRAGALGQSRDFIIATSVVPVQLRLGFESIRQDEILVRSTSGVPLAAIAVPGSELELARREWRARVLAAEGFVLCTVLLLLGGPMLDWRRLSPSINRHVWLTAGILILLASARSVAWLAIRLGGLDRPPMASPQLAGPFRIVMASPLDFLLTALAFGALVALIASSFEQWRQGRRGRVHVVPERGLADVLTFIAAQALAGGLAGALLVGYEEFLRTRLVLMPLDVLHFSLHPFEAPRLAIATGLVVLHAALLALLVLIFRVALARWVIAGNYRWIRAWIPILWAGPARRSWW